MYDVTEALRVLIVDDDDAIARLVVQELQQDGRVVEFERVGDAAATRDALQRGSWHLVISDWSMRSFSALAALEIVREVAPGLPFIIVSGTIGEEAAVEAMRAGARDVVSTDRLGRLGPAVEREIRESKALVARLRAEAGLRADDARFRALVERSDDGISLTARDGTTLYLSPGARRILGVEAGAGADPSAFEAVHPDDRERAQATLGSLLERPGESEAFEFRVVRPDGSCVWIGGTVTNLVDDPSVGGMIANFRDVSAQRRSGDALRASEKRFSRLSESGLIGIAFADVLGNLHDANDAFLQILGYSRADAAAGLPGWDAMTPPDQRDRDLQVDEQLRTTGIGGPWEKEIFRKDGSRVLVLLGVAILDYPNCIAFMADLSDRARAEAALQRSEEQLRDAQKMEAVGRLAGGIAHDFNNLLSVVLGYNDMALADLPTDDPLRENLEEVRKAAERAAELTRQLLAFSRQQVLQPRVVCLVQLLYRMEAELARLVGAGVTMVLPDRSMTVYCWVDPGQIEYLVTKLVANARDAMPAGGALTLEASNVDLDDAYAAAHRDAQPGPHVMLAVTDDGEGMDEPTLARIFEPFFTTRELGKGTGLGLSTVLGIVQQSGGSISVESAPGRGTTVRVFLPRVDPSNHALRSPFQQGGR